jgi:hypothetical protein
VDLPEDTSCAEEAPNGELVTIAEEAEEGEDKRFVLTTDDVEGDKRFVLTTDDVEGDKRFVLTTDGELIAEEGFVRGADNTLVVVVDGELLLVITGSFTRGL